VYEAIYRGRATDLAGITALPTALRQSLAERIAFGLPEIARRFESADGTRRYLLASKTAAPSNRVDAGR